MLPQLNHFAGALPQFKTTLKRYCCVVDSFSGGVLSCRGCMKQARPEYEVCDGLPGKSCGTFPILCFFAVLLVCLSSVTRTLAQETASELLQGMRTDFSGVLVTDAYPRRGQGRAFRAGAHPLTPLLFERGEVLCVVCEYSRNRSRQ